MPKIEINGLRYHYWQCGPKRAPHVLMVHGLGGNQAVWYAGIAQGLWDRYRITTFDLASHGHSGSPSGDFTLAEMIRDLETFLDRFGIDRTHLVGHCLGGDIALNLAFLRPTRIERVVVIETVLADLAERYKSPDWEGWAYFAGEFEKQTGVPVPEDKRTDMDYLMERVREAPLMHGPARGRRRKTKQLERLREGLDMLRQAQASEEDGDGASIDNYRAAVRLESLPQIPHQVLLVYEADSLFMSSHHALRERLPQSRSVFVPPAKIRHLSVLDHSKTMSAYIRAFIDDGRIERVGAAELARAGSMPV